MKPIDLCESNIYNNYEDNVKAHSSIRRKVEPYWNKDAVVAYCKTATGVVFLLKGKIKFWPFYRNFFTTASSYDYNFDQLNDKVALSFLEKHGTIVDEKLWQTYKNRLMVEAL